jgi:intracellular septation protein
MTNEKTKEQAASSQLATDLGPALIFMIAYFLGGRFAPEGEAIYWATAVFIPATLFALGYAWFKQKRVPAMLLVTATIVTVFGGLTLYLHNPWFVYVKPTIINLLWASAIFGGLLFKQNIWKMLFQSAFTLPDHVWTVFAVRWGLFFIFLAGLNIVVWQYTTEAFWVGFKVFGVIPLTIAFMALNMPMLLKHQKSDGDGKA